MKFKQLLQLLLLVVLVTDVVDSATASQLCDVEGTSPVVILDLPESVGNQTDQLTSPPQLPLLGEAGEDIEITLSPEAGEHFTLVGKQLRLLRPLDRDVGDRAVLRFMVRCRVLRAGAGSEAVERSVPVVVRVVDANDNVPTFVGAPYVVTVPEDTPVGAPVFEGLLATDADHGANGQIRYAVVPGDGGPTDGYGTLVVPQPHLPLVALAAPLDYETTSVLVVLLQASDNAPTNQQTSVTTLTVKIEDSDDQDPLLLPSPCYPPDPQGPPLGGCPTPHYSASVVAGVRVGALDVLPQRVRGVDLDTQEAPIRYSVVGGTPSSFRQFFSVDPLTGALSQLAAVPRGLTDSFSLQVQAEEQTPRRGSATAPLTITVTNPDAAVPELHASAAAGTVLENAPPGTPVLDGAGAPLTLSVSDPDLLPGEAPPPYLFELTTGAFKVTPDGVVVVAVPGLDRDPPNTPTHSFQVVAREVTEDDRRGPASAPLPLVVTLGDVNDNSPRFPLYPPVLVPAGNKPLALTTVGAEDPDAGDPLQYRLVGVGGGDPSMFQVDPTTGLVRVVGPVHEGDSFQLHIEATDGGGLTGSTLLEVRGTRGPNTGGPYFPRRTFSAVIPEGTAPGTTVITLQATDPDGDVPRYSLHPVGGSGQPLPPFQVDPLTGGVTLSGPLDREVRGSYEMIITAEDDEGLRGSVTLVVEVADVNDVQPTFVGLPYSFRAVEGERGAYVGVVQARDEDEGRSGLLQYSVPPTAPLAIGPYNGSLYTRVALDYEKQQVHYVVVTATDSGRPPLSATATVTLLVGDVSDEPPIFPQTEQQVAVGEDAPVGELVATVEAVDPDSTPSVSYVMRGVSPPLGTSLFSVARDTGRVTVTGPLDREVADRYELRVGTAENVGTGNGAECRVVVVLSDVNDHTPTLAPLPPVLVPLHTPPGGTLVTAVVVDGDATPPNNEVRYSLEGDPIALEHVAIDPQTGVLTLTRPFEGLNTTELTAEVVARDQGSPPRSSSTPLQLLVEVEGAPPPRLVLPPAFSRNKVSVSVREDARVGGIIARVGVINPPPHPRCGLLEDTEEYQALLTTSGHCALHLTAPLDADGPRDGNTLLTLVLLNANETQPLNVTAKINITVEDVNDNAPSFNTSALGDPALPGGGRGDDAVLLLSPDTVLVTVSGDSDVGTVVLQLNATDPDGGADGEVTYSLLPEGNRGGYFGVRAATGAVVTARALTDVPDGLNPFNLTVVASDRPADRRSNEAVMFVVVNVIGPSHRVVLEVAAPLRLLQEKRQVIAKALAQREDAGVVLEKVGASTPRLPLSPRHNEGVGEAEPTGEVWLALLDPHTGQLLPTTHPRVNRVLSQPSDSPGSLRYDLLQAVGPENLLQLPSPTAGVTKTKAPPPLAAADDVFGGTTLSAGGPESIIAAVPGLQLGLVVLAVAILVLGLVSILFICVQWARAMRDREKIAALPVIRAPFIHHHPPPSSITDTLHKQYEVQVLHMSVPVDEDSLKDHPAPPTRAPHNFYMDNVSYISKNNPQADDSRSDAGFPPMDSPPSPRRSPPSPWVSRPSTSRGFSPASGLPHLLPGNGYIPQRDSDADDSDEDVGRSPYSPSVSNSNVVFGRRTLERTSQRTTTDEGRTAFNESDDGPDVAGYGFEGAGIAPPFGGAPLDLSPVHTTTLL